MAASISPNPTPMVVEEKKKSRLSRILQSRKSRDSESTFANDSAYASSENKLSDVAPFDNNGQIPGVSSDRNLILDKKTGEVVDEDSGDVVTTFTTVTTTTTTTSTKTTGGKKVDVRSTTTSRSPNTPAVDPTHLAPINDQPVELATNSSGFNTPSLTATTPLTNATGTLINNPGPGVNSRTSSGVPPILRSDTADTAPTLPKRSSHRKSYQHMDHEPEPVSPVSPVNPQTNFSYPNRGQKRFSVDESEGSPRKSGAFSNLKAAAVGLHGVGETLRGTLNDTVDRKVHVPGIKTESTLAAHEKNASTLERGRAEMYNLRTRNSSYRKQVPSSSSALPQDGMVNPDHVPTHTSNGSFNALPSVHPGYKSTQNMPPYNNNNAPTYPNNPTMYQGNNGDTTHIPVPSAEQRASLDKREKPESGIRKLLRKRI